MSRKSIDNSVDTLKASTLKCIVKPEMKLKELPTFKPGPIVSELGFTRSESLALKQAWSLIQPYERLYGMDLYYTFLVEHHQAINKFRENGKLDLERLHSHARRMMRFWRTLINERLDDSDVSLFHSMLHECNATHTRRRVDMKYIYALACRIKDYVLKILEKVSSPTLERGFDKIISQFQELQNEDTLSNSPFFIEEYLV